MVLSRKAILAAVRSGAISITPFSEDQVGAAHVNLHLGALPGGQHRITLGAHCFITLVTREHIVLPDTICGFFDGRASLAKQGLSMYQSSTFIEPGTDNPITLEIFNASEHPCTLEADQEVGKLLLTPVIDGIS